MLVDCCGLEHLGCNAMRNIFEAVLMTVASGAAAYTLRAYGNPKREAAEK